MDQETPPKNDEPNDIESILRSLTPAKCEIPQATVMYRCGYEAGRQSVVTKPSHHSSHKRWTDLLLSACVVAMMVGPASYWAGARQQASSASISTTLAEETKSAEQPKAPSLAQTPVNLEKAIGAPGINYDSSTGPIEKPSPITRFWDQQIAKFQLQTPEASNRSPYPSAQNSYYLTSRTQLFTADPEEELSRLDRIYQSRKSNSLDENSQTPPKKTITPRTAFQRNSIDGNFNPQHWEDLIQ